MKTVREIMLSNFTQQDIAIMGRNLIDQYEGYPVGIRMTKFIELIDEEGYPKNQTKRLAEITINDHALNFFADSIQGKLNPQSPA